jgi:hypothetical protein
VSCVREVPVDRLPVELLIALQTDWVSLVSAGPDGDVASLGRWIVVREYTENDEGERFVSSMRAFRFPREDTAAETLRVLVEEVE